MTEAQILAILRSWYGEHDPYTEACAREIAAKLEKEPTP